MKTQITTEQIVEREKKAIEEFAKGFKRRCLIFGDTEASSLMEDYLKVYFQNHYE